MNMNKNYIYRIGIVLAMLLVFTAPAAADNVVYFDPDPSCAEPGEEITVTLWFDHTDGVAAFNDDVHFDPNVVNITGGTPGDLPAMWLFVHYGDFVRFGGWSADYHDVPPGHHVLAYLTFVANNTGTSTQYHEGNDSFNEYAVPLPNQVWNNGAFNCPCGPQTYTISGYTDTAADTVKITNLDKPDVVDDRPADYIGTDGFYNLTLNVTAEVEAGDELQIIACEDLGDYESNCNVSTYTVVNAPGEDVNVNLTLNHYCKNYYPSYPFHTWEEDDWSGPAAMEMMIDHYRDAPDVPNQTELNETGIGYNQDRRG
jgi:hypothetical protein